MKIQLTKHVCDRCKSEDITEGPAHCNYSRLVYANSEIYICSQCRKNFFEMVNEWITNRKPFDNHE